MNNALVLKVENLQVSTVNRINQLVHPLISDISFEVHAGETLCIVGESGSGKSISSMAVMGLLPKDSLKINKGNIFLEGENIAYASESRLRELRALKMSMVFQEPMTALNPVHTVGEQIEEVLLLHSKLSKSVRKKTVLEMLEAVHLPDVERIYHSYPHQLSGGQRQRVVIAMALILKPKLLIADEPTTALDVTTQKQILFLIKELQQKNGTAVVFITHDFGVVADIADRILVMNKGQVVETGDKQNILSNPSQQYTRDLVASVPSLIPVSKQHNDNRIVLSVSNLVKKYSESQGLFRAHKEFLAVNDVSFCVRKGEIVGVVGESGSGKSTVARCIMKLTDISEGKMYLNDKDITALKSQDLGALRKQIQLIFQDPYRSLNPRRKIGDSVIEGLLNYGMSYQHAIKKAEHTIKMVGLPVDALERYPHQFSGGQRQRVCIARALVMEPDVLVADEAVSALDVSVQTQVLDLLHEIKEKVGIGILFITHDLRVAAQICDRILVMRKGQLVESGLAVDILSNPAHDYTKSLLDAAPGRYWDFQNFRAVA